MPNPIIAKAVTVSGEAYAHNSMGELRLLDEGDELLEGETILTPEGSRVELELIDGTVITIHEASRKEIGRALMKERPVPHTIDLSRAAAARRRARFSDLIDGDAVRDSAGQNLFFDEKPLYWMLDPGRGCAMAIAHVASGDEFVDQTVFELQLSEDDASCGVSVAEGSFSVETHHIPFATGEPEPGRPVKFFGITDDSDAPDDGGMNSRGFMSAEVGSIGSTNLWSLLEDEVAFEFLSEQEQPDLPPRAINNFTFRNTGANSASLIARAYRGEDCELVYQAGNEDAPVRLPPGAVFSVVAGQNYDRLVLTPVSGCETCSGMQLHMESYSEFTSRDVSLSVAAYTVGSEGKTVEGRFELVLSQQGGTHRDLRFEASAITGAYDSIWDQLGLRSGGHTGEHH
jgi:hypothetical protein